MAISFVAAGTVATGTDPVVPVPTGYQTNDFLIIVTVGTASPSSITGWTQITAQGAGQFVTAFYKFASASESSVNLLLTGTTSKAVMLAYRGVGYFDVISSYNTGTSTSPATLSQTTTFANDYVLSIYGSGVNNGTNWTAAGSTTSRVNSSPSNTVQGLLIADELQASAGATTARTATLSKSTAWSAVSISIREPQTFYWVGGSGTWNTSTNTPWALSSGGAGSKGVPTQLDNTIIDNSSGTGTITCTSGVCNNLTVTTANAVVLGATSSTLNLYGNLSFPSGGAFSANTNVWTLSVRTDLSQTITTNSKTLSNISFAGGGTYTLQDNLTSSGTINFTVGTIALGNNTLTCNIFSATGLLTKVITRGTGNINITGNATTILTILSGSYGSGLIFNCNYSGSTGTRTINASGVNISISAGTDTVTFTSGNTISALDFTGFSGTWANVQITIGGDCILSSGMTVSSGANTVSFSSTQSRTLTTNGQILDFPVTFSGGSGTLTLQDNCTIGSTRTTTLTSGTLVLGTTSSWILSTGFFASSNSNSRTITTNTSGFSQITLTGSNGTIWDTATTTNLTTTGFFKVVSTYSGSTGTRTFTLGGLAYDFKAGSVTTGFSCGTTGTDTVSVTGTAIANFDLSNFTGTLANTAMTITGNYTLDAGVNLTAGPAVTTFAAASGTQQILTDNKLIPFPLTINAPGVTVSLQSNLLVGPARALTLTAGTFSANTYTVSAGVFSSNNSNTRTINMGSNTWSLSGTGIVWDLATTTNLTFNKNTANIILSTTSTNARTFAGGGLTYNNLTIGGATGISTLTVTGNNTFNTISSTKTVAHTITFTAGTTTTVSNWTVSGTSGNVVTLNSSSVGSTATLTKTGGGTITVDYMDIKDSIATPTSTWYATNSVDSGNNTGWNFGGNSNFFRLFPR